MVTWKHCGVWTISLLSWTIFAKMYRKGKDCNPMYLEFKNNTSIAYQTAEELQRIKDNVGKNFNQSTIKNKLNDLKNQIQKDTEELQKINNKLSEDNLIESFKRYWSLYEEVVFGMAIDIYFDDILCSELSSFLKKKINNKSKYNRVFSIITAPIKLTRTQKEESGFLNLLLQKKPNFEFHLKKWAFIPMWFDNSPWTIKDLRRRAELYKNEVENKINEFSSLIKTRKQEINKIISELDPPKRIIELINIISEFAHLRQEGEIQISYHNYQGLSIRKMICTKLNISLNDLKFLTDTEIIENLQKLNSNIKNIIIERQKYCFAIFKNGNYFIYTSKQAQLKVNEIKSKIIENVKTDVKKIKAQNTLRGIIGSIGTAKGKVFVIHKLEDLDKIKKENIMIVSGTSVEYISAMERAAGIISEYGGITSHAAVIARELNKPCIIQVKNATKLLKNNELIELDAEKGIITILNQK